MLYYILIGLLGSAYFSFFFSAILVGVSILIAYTYAYLVDSEIKIKYIVKTFFAVWILNTIAFPILILNGAFFRTDPYPGDLPSKAQLIGIFFLELAFLTLFFYLRYKVHTVKQNESHVFLTKAWDSAYEVTPVTLEEIRTAIYKPKSMSKTRILL